ncbi:putative chromatin-remodeling ATPase INO80-like 4 [Homarus americanus]|uniref:Putative chromatin-remodeling ATPase INO80-like 4 n=1 Tax=Homarus americanus TaxID=6706 RepID=A0A8J5JB24_HOMAM|nr:putative chromatin-remodeling ATPase INO80-like 4 [Homarus americanus]
MGSQGDGGGPASTSRGPRTRQQRGPRPRTIHIDVYCSSSSDVDSSSPSSPVSEDTLDSGPRRPHAVVALGSKQRKKTELNLGRHHYHPLEEKASSFVYSRGRAPHTSRRTTFITDDLLPLCSSPPPTTPDKDDLAEEVAAAF